jgi:hypothetical protein
MNFPVELEDWIENQRASEDENVGRDMYGLQPFPPVPGRKECNAAVAFKERRRDLA